MERVSVVRKVWDWIWTFIVVTIITVLVWLYAESESVKPQSLDMDLQFVAPQGRLMAIEPREAVRVHLVFRCANSVLAEIERQSRGNPIPIEVKDSSEKQVFVLRDALAGNPLFKNFGISISEAQPVTVDVIAQKRESVTLPIEFTSGDLQIGPDLKINPKEAVIQAPSNVAPLLGAEKVQAVVDPSVLARLEVNQEHTLEAQLRLPARFKDLNLAIVPSAAKITLTLRKQTESYTLPNIPVKIILSATELSRFNVTIDEDQRFLRDLTLTGPSDAIEAIRKDPGKPFAGLQLTTEDLEKNAGKEKTFAVELFRIPSTVTFPLPSPVKLKIVKKEQ